MSLKFSINQCQLPLIVFTNKLKLINTNTAAKKLFKLKTESTTQKQLIVERGLGKKTIITLQKYLSLKQPNFVSQEIRLHSKWYNTQLLYCDEKQFILQLIEVSHLVKIKNQLINVEKKAQVLLDELPIIIYEEDFSDIKKKIDGLKRKGIKDFKQYFFQNPNEVKELASLIKVTAINKHSLKFYEVGSFEELLMEIPKWFMEESWPVFRDEMIAIANGKFEFKSEIVVKSPIKKIKHLYLSMYIPKGNRKKLDKVIISFVDITERVGVEKKLNESLKKFSSLSQHLHKIREIERKEIASQIHDEAGSMITVLKMSIASLQKKMPQNDNIKSIISISNQADELYTFFRNIATSLRPSIIDELGLLAALKWQTNEFNKRVSLKISFTSNQAKINCDSEIGIYFFRFYQELINNVLKHANTNIVFVSLNQTKQRIQLIVKDFGVGFDQNKKNKETTLGLLSIDERAKMIGAKFSILSKPGVGTTAKIILPMQEKSKI